MNCLDRSGSGVSARAETSNSGLDGPGGGTLILNAHTWIGDVRVERSAGHPDLDDAATDAVKRWRFDPARRGSEAVAMWVLLPVEFKLR